MEPAAGGAHNTVTEVPPVREQPAHHRGRRTSLYFPLPHMDCWRDGLRVCSTETFFPLLSGMLLVSALC